MSILAHFGPSFQSMNALGDQSQPNHGESLLAGRLYGLSCKPQCVPRSVRAKSLDAVCISAFEVSFGAGGSVSRLKAVISGGLTGVGSSMPSTQQARLGLLSRLLSAVPSPFPVPLLSLEEGH